jgi:hypothetical protein
MNKMVRKKQEDRLADVPHNIFESRWGAMSPEEKRKFLEKYPYSLDNRPGGYTYEEYWGMRS